MHLKLVQDEPINLKLIQVTLHPLNITLDWLYLSVNQVLSEHQYKVIFMLVIVRIKFGII